jgi:hypothetical protein
MERLTAKQIKKIVYGITLSDAHIEPKGRLHLYSEHRDYVEYIASVLNQITGVVAKVRVRNDKRGYIGYIVDTNCHTYFKTMRKHTYGNRKNLTKYNVSRLDVEALAHIYMCDGYTEHAKNRKANKVQNKGWFCLEAFPPDELSLLVTHLSTMGIEARLSPRPWGYGYRLKMGGDGLQKFISMIYPYLLDCFKYKADLFYKGEAYVLDLPSAEQYIKYYDCVEDIVRYSKKLELT